MEEGTRQARSVDLIAQRRLLELHMRSQVSLQSQTPDSLIYTCLGPEAYARSQVGRILHNSIASTSLLLVKQDQA